MSREYLNDLNAFLAVAREKSFTRAAAKLGVSQSALSHTIRQLEQRLGIPLLTRTTRSVSTTHAGDYLVRHVGPHLDQIETQISAIGQLQNRPSGTIRITAADDAIACIIRPKLSEFLRKYPEIKVELNASLKMVDLIKERFDAGVRMGEHTNKEMASIPITSDVRFVVVGSPSYFKGRKKPQNPSDLLQHNCITMRLPTRGGIYAWEFEKDGEELKIRVDGQLVLNGSLAVCDACLDGIGLGHMPEMVAKKYIADGRLISVLQDWLPFWSGYHLCFPHNHENTMPFSLFAEEMRYTPEHS
ncbi:LysR family transcriptional regulator [Komagataeibacter oboediens]